MPHHTELIAALAVGLTLAFFAGLLATARLVVVTTPDPVGAQLIVEHARQVNPDVRIVARTYDEHTRAELEQLGADLALFGEHELARSMTGHALGASTERHA